VSSLAGALAVGSPSAVDPVPALERIGAHSGRDALAPVLEALERMPIGPSPARKEIQSRLRRTPLEVASQLAEIYGHELPSVVYIPAVAVIGRLRLGQFLGHSATLRDIESIVKPYLDGKPTLGDQPTGSHLPGHLIFGELARATGNEAYTRLAVRAADLGFDSRGEMLESMPLHNEMSDSVFMGCAILAQAGNLTGDERYYRMALRHLRFMEALDLRTDGLYRHSPLDDAAWGRGNGFSILGLTWSLSEMSENSPGSSEFLAAYRELIDTLLKYQDPTGMWRQIIDHEESYRELTSTSMIGYALSIGLRNGWITGSHYEHALERAWYGVKTRIAAGGSLVDVCTGTGKQPDLRAYFDRTAILGRDDRGGAMALLFAVEMASREKSK
jgi:rhamnogalacturonyl hydrolase YesR